VAHTAWFDNLRRLLVGIALVAASAPSDAAELVVSAASSLSNAFTAIGHAFEAGQTDVKVVLNFAASDVLLKQIEQGAPSDVFASADEATMDRAVSARLVDAATRKDFAGNTLVVVVATDITGPAQLADLADAAYAQIAIGNPDAVPAGRYAKQALVAAGLWDRLQAQFVPTQNVRQALDYVARGEAQAGLVYATDAAQRNDKVRVALSVPTATPVRYPIAATTVSTQGELARRFVDFVVSADGQAVLGRYGFSPSVP
jgi:molybdate transport system substrate-binding protein